MSDKNFTLPSPHVSVGEYLWVINGARTRAFLVEVAGTGPHTIAVRNMDKDDEVHEYRRDGTPNVPLGTFKSSAPMLVAYADPTAQKLEQERLHREMAEVVKDLASEFRSSPSEVTYRALLTEVKNWGVLARIDA